MDFNAYGCDIVFRITRPADKRLIALAKSGFVFFNYMQSKVVPISPDVLTTFQHALADKASASKKDTQ